MSVHLIETVGNVVFLPIIFCEDDIYLLHNYFVMKLFEGKKNLILVYEKYKIYLICENLVPLKI